MRTSEVVAIKKMSYSGKQSNEVKINAIYNAIYAELREITHDCVSLQTVAYAYCISHDSLFNQSSDAHCIFLFASRRVKGLMR